MEEDVKRIINKVMHDFDTISAITFDRNKLLKEIQYEQELASGAKLNPVFKDGKMNIVFPCVLDYVYKNEIKPMWDGGFLKNFLIDYKTGLVSITPIQALRSIEVDIDVDVQTSRKR